MELTINGKKIQAEKGQTILQAALANGIKIPNLCYDKRLVPYGGCRLCIVEIEGSRKLEASCATLAKEGMNVFTDTPKVRKVRQRVIELMLVHHPLDCPTCDKAGECTLQDLAFEYGQPRARFVRERKDKPADSRDPLIEINANRCILCGKCVRICAEHQGRGALGLIGRGFPTVVQPAFGEVLNCDYCGQCIDVCPTGSLLNKSFKYKARPWMMEEADTICPFCGCGCTLTVGKFEGKIARSRGHEDTGVSKGSICSRGRFGVDYIYGGERIEQPMVRINGKLAPSSWEEALKYAGDCLKYVVTVHGPSAVGAIGSPRCSNEDNYVLQKFMRQIGSDNIDSSAALGYGIAEKVWQRAFGLSGHKVSLSSPLGKEAVLVIESDLNVTHPSFGINLFKATREGTKLIVADSRETRLAKQASEWVKVRQGTGTALLNGISKVLLDKGLYDTAHAPKIKGFEELKKSLEEYTPEKAGQITGTGAEAIIAIAESLASAKSRMLALSIGPSENAKGGDAVMAAANLINLLGESPDALQIPAEYANTFGLYKVGVRPDAGPMYQPVDQAGQGLPEMLYGRANGAGRPPVKALYVMGADPAATFPDSQNLVKRLSELDLLIVQDVVLTETAKLAHVVFPAAGWAEKDGTFTNAEGVSQGLCRIVDPPGASLPDWKILADLSEAMGSGMGIKGRRDITDELLRMEPGTSEPATPEFHAVRYNPGEEPDEAYPLSLVVRDVLQHAGSISTRSRSLGLVSPEATIEISRRDAGKLGIAGNERVRVVSRRGKASLTAIVSDEVPDGAVYVPAHFPESGVNSLRHLSGNGEGPLDAVRIEKS